MRRCKLDYDGNKTHQWVVRFIITDVWQDGLINGQQPIKKEGDKHIDETTLSGALEPACKCWFTGVDRTERNH